MDIIKNKSSHPIQLIVRASRKHTSSHTSKISTSFWKDRIDLLPSPAQYYFKELKRFVARKIQASALCPFHHDRNPSFSVNLQTGAYICFACGACGKSIISFHMRRYGISRKAAYKAMEGIV